MKAALNSNSVYATYYPQENVRLETVGSERSGDNQRQMGEANLLSKAGHHKINRLTEIQHNSTPTKRKQKGEGGVTIAETKKRRRVTAAALKRTP